MRAVLVTIGAHVVMCVILLSAAWLVRGRWGYDAKTRATYLRHSPVLRAGLMFGVGLGVGAAVSYRLRVADGTYDPKSHLLTLAVLFLGCCIPGTIEMFRRRIVLDERGITPGGWFGDQACLLWSEIEFVELNWWKGRYYVEGWGRKIKIDHALSPIGAFADECRARLSPHIYGQAFDEEIEDQIFFF